MRIGLVYDLRDDYRALGLSEEECAEFDSAETIAELAGALRRQGAEVVGVGHGRALAAALVAGTRYDLVLSIAEGVKGRSREAQVPALCELFDQPYAFSDPLTLAATLDKAVAKRLVRDAGVPTAPFAVLARPEEARAVDLGWPVFVKPIAEGTGKGCENASRCEDAGALERVARDLIARFDQPALVEPFLPGREFTVGILGTGETARVIGTIEVLLGTKADAVGYTYANKADWEDRVRYVAADDATAREAAAVALAAHRALDCRDVSRCDLRCDARGRPVFLETNPLPGLKPDYSDLPILAKLSGIAYDDLIGELLEAAVARLGIGGKRQDKRQDERRRHRA
ncbi:MAG: D-alanine--D-alanine ligase [Alphaproteobacteria bacterium]|nr:D-alanine--D-alanine ligase [Alphaproteobacteria bacterium]